MIIKQNRNASAGVFFRMFFLVIVSCFCCGCSRKEPDFFISAEQQEEDIADIPLQPSEAPALPMIYVEVCGAVKSPGVYELEQNGRVFQALEAAGGVREDAAEGFVNQAQILTDGQQIYIPTKEEAETEGLSENEINIVSDGQQALPGEQHAVNINTADAGTLMSLTGIGESKAMAIIAYREEHGRFASVEELMNVQGIKEGTFTRIKENIVIE